MLDVEFTGVFDEMLARMQGEEQRIKVENLLKDRKRPLTREEIADIGAPKLGEES